MEYIKMINYRDLESAPQTDSRQPSISCHRRLQGQRVSSVATISLVFSYLKLSPVSTFLSVPPNKTLPSFLFSTIDENQGFITQTVGLSGVTRSAFQFYFMFETGSCCVAEAILPLPPEHWDYRSASAYLESMPSMSSTTSLSI